MLDETSDFRVTMPREYFLLIDHLYNLQEKSKGIFINNDYKYSKTVQFNRIIEWLDTWSEEEFRKYNCYHLGNLNLNITLWIKNIFFNLIVAIFLKLRNNFSWYSWFCCGGSDYDAGCYRETTFASLC